MTGLRFSACILFLIALLLLLQYRLWFQAGGVFDMLKLKKQLTSQLEYNTQLKNQAMLLTFQVQRLRHDHEQTEERARNELGMIKKEEKFYQIVK